MSVKPFFDTNIPVYAFSENDPRVEVARILLAAGGIISVQVLNETTSIMRRKLKMSWVEVTEAMGAVRIFCPTIISLTPPLYDSAVQIADRYGYQIYDSLIVATALQAKCRILYSEDMKDGQVIDGLTIRNPFTKNPDC